ncbi:MAG: hypothetical protein MK291_10640, partial [Planctomycetes bacterium]|nr:hypothetical protein [Planctomycetota bacterium]
MPPRPTPPAHERLIAEREGYSVSAIRIESLPGHWVTGNLYRPTGDGPFPAVLCPHGHWPEGRFTDRADHVEKELSSGGEVDPVAARYHLQARCVHLARMGCLVIHYDMVGYADATALSHTSDLTSLEAQSFGVNHLGLQTWNSIRLVDHLVSRDDVDPARVGVTGGSGGGTQSFILGALDERVRVAFPAVMVGTEMQGGCVCENAPHLRVGTSNIGISALIAPRALGMTGADDWTLHIEERGLPELKQVWGLYDRADAIHAKCYPQFGHNYNSVGRAEMYAVLARHLELGEPIPEQTFEPFAPAELSVYTADDPRPEELDAAQMLAWWRGQVEDSLRSREVRDRESLAAWKRDVSATLRAMLHTSLPPHVEVRDRREVTCEGGLAQALVLARPETEEAVSALYVEPRVWSGAVRVIASSEPWRTHLTAGAWEDMRERARADATEALLLIDCLGVGAEEGARFDDSRSGYEGYTTGYNRALVAERAHDLLTAVAFAGELPGAKSVHLAGLDRAGPWAVLAAALSEGALTSLVANRSWSFKELQDPRHPDFLPGALRVGGMPGITAACAPLQVELTDPAPLDPLVTSAWRAARATPPRVAR